MSRAISRVWLAAYLDEKSHDVLILTAEQPHLQETWHLIFFAPFLPALVNFKQEETPLKLFDFDNP